MYSRRPEAGQGAEAPRAESCGVSAAFPGQDFGIARREHIIKSVMDERTRLTAMVKAAG